MSRYVCIHGHFYQPPRENPWLEAIEVQDSAWPFHDWNERISAECYRTNAAARILDDDGRIERIINNYSRISFNFGPTLLSWMEHAAPEVLRAIRRADALSRARFSGHGSALAQVYNHMILPLATHRDRVTQVRWGLADFQRRFGRAPEGMWLAETAVDTESLEVLAEHGIRFTILAPNQAHRFRRMGEDHWHDASGGRIDPSRAYEQRLPSGRRMALFFYDGPVSRAVAFEHLLESGERFAGRLAGVFDEKRDGPQLSHIATDGETYGHHHRHGEMALAYALEHLEESGVATLTNYGEFLERHPPEHEVEIAENTSWSCAHGIERWRSDCGCSTGGGPGWNQAWRTPLREALDDLRDALAPRYEEEAAKLLSNPWATRDAYVEVVLDRSEDSVDRFLESHASHPLDEAERVRAISLLEMQRHAMLMFTSCGWFFNDVSGIETVQVLQYAARAIQLARRLLGEDLEPPFLAKLEEARSNVPAKGTGRDLYERQVRPAMVDLAKVGAHFALSSLFEAYDERERVYGYRAERDDYVAEQAGRARLAVGRVRITSTITGSTDLVSFGVLHFGDQNLTAGVARAMADDAYASMTTELRTAFARSDLAETVRLLDHHFGERAYGLRSLFRDEQRKILGRILDAALDDAEAGYRRLYESYLPLMRFVDDLGAPLPRVLKTTAAHVTNLDLKDALDSEEVDAGRVAKLVGQARDLELELDTAGLAYTLERSLEDLCEPLENDGVDRRALERIEAKVRLKDVLAFDVDLWRTQNAVWRVLNEAYPARRRQAEAGDAEASSWVADLERLASALSMRVLPPEQG